MLGRNTLHSGSTLRSLTPKGRVPHAITILRSHIPPRGRLSLGSALSLCRTTEGSETWGDPPPRIPAPCADLSGVLVDWSAQNMYARARRDGGAAHARDSG